MHKCLVAFSVILDLGMLVQALIAINMIVNARVYPCDDIETRLFFSGISLVTILRVSHLIFMAFFVLCCLPCYFCPDQCCIKRKLINPGSLSKQSVALVETRWTWRFSPNKTTRFDKNQALLNNSNDTNKDPVNCPLCFLQFERGQQVSYLPC